MSGAGDLDGVRFRPQEGKEVGLAVDPEDGEHMGEVISYGVGTDVHRRRDGRYSLSPQQTVDDATLPPRQLVERRHMGCIDRERLGITPAAGVELGCEPQQMAFEA